MITGKRCSGCGQKESEKDFSEVGLSPDELDHWCQQCETVSFQIRETKVEKNPQFQLEVAVPSMRTHDSHVTTTRAYHQQRHEQIWEQRKAMIVPRNAPWSPKDVQVETKKVANKIGAPWTVEDIELARSENIALKDLALMLGRTYSAVSAMRNRPRSKETQVFPDAEATV
ncbi:hypothetical protein AAFM46_16530 (plasmid) [Arthrobacter sp. TMP15]|uniref:hypothetical protein n=1 Tax=Arthrobacter sp. TMP15 TaxID=3140789 RepID=UPI0031BB70C0